MNFEDIIADIQAFFSDLVSGDLDFDALIAKIQELLEPIISAITDLFA